MIKLKKLQNKLFFLCVLGMFFQTDIATSQNKTSFAVVELYTSQGCSSCPAADEVFSDLSKSYQDENVFFLSFHVDYWDRLGWKDTFSQPVFSERQRAYSSYFKSRSNYTPQMIVNGKEEFVGSHKLRADATLKYLLEKEMEDLQFETIPVIDKNKLKLSYTLKSPLLRNIYVNVALVKRQETVRIKRGENRSRKINYTNIVLEFKQQEDQKKGDFVFKLPSDFDKEKYQAVVYLQDQLDGEILFGEKVW